MAGHSKWAQIKRAKGVNDVKRGALFTRIGNQIAVAARSGADPELNPSLAAVIEKAKSANMPMSTVERAIKRVSDKDSVQLEEILYEGYGPGGIAILVECATDNRNRTYPEVKHAFTKHGGSIGEANSVAFQFERKGVIIVKSSGENALLEVLEAGAEDAVENEDVIIAYTDPKDLHEVKLKLNQAGLETESAELSYQPSNTVELDEELESKLEKIIDSLEDLQDVVNVSHNGEC
ncbi:YebC/PmpR family DNA-binding transcriptional regulator [Candidatus Saccharibacteria bacterium]|nr:YebC/PmpR family DNA-binding transcriptional regulator [Candidatus Saccharibacteria bacterium]